MGFEEPKPELNNAEEWEEPSGSEEESEEQEQFELSSELLGRQPQVFSERRQLGTKQPGDSMYVIIVEKIRPDNHKTIEKEVVNVPAPNEEEALERMRIDYTNEFPRLLGEFRSVNPNQAGSFMQDAENIVEHAKLMDEREAEKAE